MTGSSISTPRTIALFSLSLFLVLSLFIFGLLFSIKMTALNAGYVFSRLDNLPLASLVDELEFDDAIEDNPKLVSFIRDTIAENETEAKERIGEAVQIAYDYLNSRSSELDMALVLKETILEPDFSISIIEKADLSPLAKQLVIEMASEVNLPYGLSIEAHIDDTSRDLEPWLREQAIIAIPSIYDYILGFNQNTDIVIQLEPAREILRDYLKRDFLASPPPAFTGLFGAELEQKFDEVFNEFAGDIWSAIEIDMELMDADIVSNVARSLSNTEEALSESRTYVGYFNLAYGLLIAFILLLIAAIILVYRQMKGTSRLLGAIFLGYGIINLIAALVSRSTVKDQLAQIEDIPSSLQLWLIQVATSSLTPLLVLTIVLLVAGAALLAVSFIWRKPAGA